MTISSSDFCSNVKLNITVLGPNINGIKAGEIYTFIIDIYNPQNLEGTVIDVFQMELKDIIPIGLTYILGSASVYGNGVTTTPIVTGQSLTMTILKLPPDEGLTVKFNVIVNNTLVSGSVITNTAILQPSYLENHSPCSYPKEVLTSSVTLKALGIILSQIVKTNLFKIEDVITYILDITVPQGTIAYNLKVIDNYPFLTQNYIGNATKNRVPITLTTLPSAGSVIFPTEAIVNAIAAQ